MVFVVIGVVVLDVDVVDDVVESRSVVQMVVVGVVVVVDVVFVVVVVVLFVVVVVVSFVVVLSRQSNSLKPSQKRCSSSIESGNSLQLQTSCVSFFSTTPSSIPLCSNCLNKHELMFTRCLVFSFRRIVPMLANGLAWGVLLLLVREQTALVAM